MKIRQILGTIILFTVLSCVFARGADSSEPVPLRVGVTPNFPPMISKEDGQIVGVEADFAKALGEELGRPVEFVEEAWEDQIPALSNGKIDIIMSAMSVTIPRQLRVDFTNPYLLVGQTILVRREDYHKYELGFPAKPEGTIGVLKSTTGDFLVQQEFPGSKRKDFASPQDAAKALIKKKIDLLICDSPTAWWLSGMNEADGLIVVPLFLSNEQMAWAVRKSNPEFLKAVNNALEKFQNDGRAKAIVKNWIPLLQ